MEYGSGEVLDPEVLASLRELQSAGEPYVVAELFGLFLGEAVGRLADMQAALANGDAPALQRAAHALKGNAANLGISRLAVLSGELEETARLGDLARARDLLARAEAELPLVQSALQAEIERD